MREPHITQSEEGRRKSATTDKGELRLGPLKSQLPLSAQQSPARCGWPPLCRACLIVFVIYVCHVAWHNDRYDQDAYSYAKEALQARVLIPTAYTVQLLQNIPLELGHVGGAQNYSPVPDPGSQPRTRGTPSEKHPRSAPPGEA